VSDLTTPIKVSGVPLGSRAGRRIHAGAGGPAQLLASRLRRLPSLLVSWIVANACALLLAGVMIASGLFVTRILLSIDAVKSADEWLPRWAEKHRSPGLDDASYIGSMIADRPVLIPLVGLVMLTLVLRKRWRMAVFVLQAGLVELLAYALAVGVVARTRPPVERLDPLTANHSFPSGHVAASVAVYGAVALLLAAHFKDIRVRVAIWSVAAVVPLVVAASRIYRGEHHPIDVTGGALMGIGALCIAAFAARTARRVAELHAIRRVEEASA
jgi:membrane-associated phospholipid phosphatase